MTWKVAPALSPKDPSNLNSMVPDPCRLLGSSQSWSFIPDAFPTANDWHLIIPSHGWNYLLLLWHYHNIKLKMLRDSYDVYAFLSPRDVIGLKTLISWLTHARHFPSINLREPVLHRPKPENTWWWQSYQFKFHLLNEDIPIASVITLSISEFDKMENTNVIRTLLLKSAQKRVHEKSHTRLNFSEASWNLCQSSGTFVHVGWVCSSKDCSQLYSTRILTESFPQRPKWNLHLTRESLHFFKGKPWPYSSFFHHLPPYPFPSSSAHDGHIARADTRSTCV